MIRIALLEKNTSLVRVIREYLYRFEAENGIRYSISHFSDENQLLLDCQYCSDYHILIADTDEDREQVMDALDGIRAADSQTQILLLSGHEETVRDGYRIGAGAFLLKPLTEENFSENFGPFLYAEEGRQRHRLMVEVDDGLQRLDESRLLFVEMKGQELVYHTLDGQVVSKGSIGETQKKLHSGSFFQCGQTFLLNLEFIEGIEKNTVFIDKSRIRVSDREKEQTMEALNRYLEAEGV